MLFLKSPPSFSLAGRPQIGRPPPAARMTKWLRSVAVAAQGNLVDQIKFVLVNFLSACE